MPRLVAAAALAAIPAIYQGYWSPAGTACAAEDTEGVRIGPRSIDFYEARSEVTSVSEGAKGASAKVTCTGEGRTWTEGVRFRVPSKNQMELVALGAVYTFRRCS